MNERKNIYIYIHIYIYIYIYIYIIALAARARPATGGAPCEGSRPRYRARLHGEVGGMLLN